MSPNPPLPPAGAPPADPENRRQAQALIAQARAALAAGQAVAAGRAAEAAVRAEPGSAEAWSLVVAALSVVDSGEVEKALAMALRHFAEDDPARALFEADRALALASRSRWEEAAAQAAAAASRPALPPLGHQALASAYTLMGRPETALPHLELAAAGLPRDAAVHLALANACRDLGRLDAAEAAYGQVLALDPDDSLAHAALARLRPWSADRHHLAALAGALQRAEPGSLAAARLAYALAKELDDLGRRPEAWGMLSAASATAGRHFPFDHAGQAARTDALVRSLTRSRLTAYTAHDPPPPRPIFILGLPRSGKALVERILAAHSDVTAMGETLALPQAVKAAARTPGPERFDIATIRAAAIAGRPDMVRAYQQATAPLARGATVVTDRPPAGYEYVGLMRLAFPKAALVHVRRAPMDCLFGAYRLLFDEGAYPWSYGLADLAASYRHYRRLMDHWREALGPALVEITLETLIEQPEAEVRRLLDGCGLPFEEACLPERASGGVSSEGAAQVRAPISRHGVGAWRRYAEQLEPLRAELERDGFVDAQGEPIWAPDA